MKSQIKALLPSVVLHSIARLRRKWQQWQNRRRSTEQVFTEIYAKNLWGGQPGEFDSGYGSAEAYAVSPYLASVRQLAQIHGFAGKRFVDLGCGDFRVGRELTALSSQYIGIDVVRGLIERNRAAFATAEISFSHLNIVSEELPDGDVCFVRQVLQHLSNQQISQVLPKLAKYRWVLITEHYPSDNPQIVANKDKAHGGDIRLFDNSGVYLTQAPFNLPPARVQLVLEVRGAGADTSSDHGVIRTYLHTPQFDVV